MRIDYNKSYMLNIIYLGYIFHRIIFIDIQNFLIFYLYNI
jgi:hypothetical protein